MLMILQGKRMLMVRAMVAVMWAKVVMRWWCLG